MSAILEGGVVWLRGRCVAEDAEFLLTTLLDEPTLVVDISEVQRIHTAVLQILLALGPKLRGVPADEFLRDHVFPMRFKV